MEWPSFPTLAGRSVTRAGERCPAAADRSFGRRRFKVDVGPCFNVCRLMLSQVKLLDYERRHQHLAHILITTSSFDAEHHTLLQRLISWNRPWLRN